MLNETGYKFKINLNEEIRNFIKENREKAGLKSFEFAKSIGKTSAYVSKFDNGDFKTIDYNDLCTMIYATTNDETEAVALVNQFLTEYILNSDNDIVYEDLGLLTFDNVLRQIEISPELISELKSIMKDADLTINKIVGLINENTILSDEVKNSSKYDYNQYYKNDDNESPIFIKLKVNQDEIGDILSLKKQKSNYMTMNAIVYAIIQYKTKDDKDKFIDQQTFLNVCEIVSEQILEKYRFFNLRKQKKFEEAQAYFQDFQNKICSLPSSFIYTIGNLINCIDAFYKLDSLYATLKMNNFANNLNRDASLFFSSFGIPYFKMSDTTIDDKKNLMRNIEKLIDELSEKNTNDSKYNII